MTQLFVQEESVVLNRKPKHTLNLTKIAKYKQVRLGFPGGSDGKASACNVEDPGLIAGSGRFPWRRKWQPTPVLLPGKSHGWMEEPGRLQSVGSQRVGYN